MGRHESADPRGAPPGDLGPGVWAGVAVRQVGLSLAGPGGPGSPALGPGWGAPAPRAGGPSAPSGPSPHRPRFLTWGGLPAAPYPSKRLAEAPADGASGGPFPLAAPGSSLPRHPHHSGTPFSGLRSLREASAAPGPRTPQLPQCTHAAHRALSQRLGAPRWGVPIWCV